MANFNFSLGFNIEKEGINKAKQELDRLKREMQANPLKFNLDTRGLQQAMQQISVFEGSLKSAFNQNLGKLDTRDFMNQLHAAGYSLEGLRDQFSHMGVDARSSLRSIENGLQSTNLSLKKTNEVIDSMADTFKNTLKWNLASQAIHGIEGSIGRAIGFTKDLDNSLNNIRIVTGKNKDEMGEFAKNANQAAQALGKTTVEYSDASLLFFQQGKSASEVRDLTKATLIGASITGQGVSDTAELLTAALNGYNMEANKAMEITDKFAAVGASTGSDFNELAIGFSKVASMANVAGVNVDQLNGMLATVSTVTREAPESIGTSFKTIFGRMTELKAGKKDEDGWALGKVNDALSKAGFSMLDKQTGKLKETGVLLEEIGSKWAGLNKETQLALSTAMAGSRQQNRLIALYSNWDMYKDALKASQEAEGTAYEQNIIRMDSIEYKAKQLRASLEQLWMSLINSDVMKAILTGLTSITGGVNKFISALGGIGPILLIIAGLMGHVFNNKISNGLVNTVSNIKGSFAARARDGQLMATDPNSATDVAEQKRLSRLQDQYKIRKYLTQEEHREYIELQKQLEVEEKKLRAMEAQRANAVKYARDFYGSEQNRDTVYKDNKIQMKSDNIAMGQLRALQQGNITAAQLNKVTKDTLAANGQTLAILQATPGAMDAFIRKLYEAVEVSKAENAIIEENRAILGNENTRDIASQRTTVSAAEDTQGRMMREMAERAERVGRVQNVVNGTMALTVGLTSATAAMKAYTEAGDDVEAKSNAAAAGIMGISSALMMSGNPYVMAAGGILGLVTAIGKLTWENTGLRKTMKENKELIESSTKAISDAKTRLQNLGSATPVLKELNDYMKDGAVNLKDLNENQLSKYYELSNKIAELAPEMVSYYDEQGNAIVNLKGNLEGLKDAQREQIELANKAKAGNAEGFSEEYSSKINLAEGKIKDNKNILDIMAKGQPALDEYNASQFTTDPRGQQVQTGKTYKMEDLGKLTAEIQTQQAVLQETGEEIRNNIILPLFSGSDAFKGMTDAQKEMARGLLSQEKAMSMIHDPEQLAAYTSELNNVMNKMGEENKLAAKKKENLAKINELKKDGLTAKEQIQVDALVNENKQYDEQIKKVSALNDQFEKLGQFKQSSMLDTLSTLGLTGEENDKALAKLTDYYSKTDTIAQGPMTTDTLRSAAGLAAAPSETDYRNEMTSKNAESENVAKAVDANSQKITATSEELRGGGKTEAELEVLRDKYSSLVAVEKDLIDQQAELSNQAIEAGINANEETKANAVLESQYWNQITALAATTEGYNQLAESYNKNLGELETLGQAAEKNINKTQMDEVAKSLDVYKDKIPGLATALASYKTNGEASFGGLAKFANQAMDDMKQQNGRSYAAMMQNDAGYFESFKKANAKQTDDIFIAYGIRATDYTNFGEYEKAVNKAKEGNKLSVSRQAANEAILKEEQRVAANAKLAKNDVDNTGKASKNKVGIWSTMTNSGLSFADKWGIGWRLIVDGTTKLFSGMANAVIDVWNGVIGIIESSINWVSDGISSLINKLPDKAKEFIGFNGSLGHANFGRSNHVSGTNLAGDYIEKTQKTTGEFDYNVDDLPTSDIDKKDPTAPGGSGNGNGDGGADVNPNAGSDKKDSKKVEDMKVELDKLHDTNVLLGQQDALLKQLKDEEQYLYGKEKQANLEKQKLVLAEKNRLLEEQLVILKNIQKEEQKKLGDKGVKFNADGTVANYNAIIQSKVNAANAIKDPDKKEAAIKAVQDFIKELEAYETLTLKTVIDKEQAIDEATKTLHELTLVGLEYKITVRLDLAKDQHDFNKFLTDMDTEFEDISDKYNNGMNDLSTTFGEIAAIEAQINDIMTNESYTEGEKLEKAKKYQLQLQQAIVSAAKLREELEKINEEAIKKGLDLLNKQLDKYQHIGNELGHIEKMMTLIGQGKNFEQLDKIYEAQGKNQVSQLDSMLSARDALKAYVGQLKEGSDEWEYANDQLNKMDEQINKMTEETLKTFQQEFNNSVNGIMDQMDKDLSGGIGMDKLKSQWADAKAEQEKYLSVQEKIVWAGNLQHKVQQQINEATNPATKAKLQKFLDEELGALKDKDKLTKNEADRAEKIYDITQKQIALDEARNNRTIQRLVRDASGNWSYQYVEDTKKVAEAQAQLSNKLQDLMTYDQKAFNNAQDEMIATKEKFAKEIQDIIKRQQNGEYASTEEFNRALIEAQTRFNEKAEQLQTESGALQEKLSESTLAVVLNTYSDNKDGLGILTEEQEKLLTELGKNVGTEWGKIRDVLTDLNTNNAKDFKEKYADVVTENADGMFKALKATYANVSGEWSTNVTTLIGSNTTLKGDVDKAVEGIMKKWGEYETKVKGVTTKTGENVDDLGDKTDDLSDDIDVVSESTKTVIDRMKEEWTEVGKLIKVYEGLSDGYDDLIADSVAFVKQLQEQIKTQKEAATGVTTPGDNPKAEDPKKEDPKKEDPKPEPKPDPKPTPTPPVKGGAVRVKSGRRWYHDSEGANPSGPTDSYSNTNMQITTTAKGAKYPYNVGRKSGEYLGWLRLEDLQGFRSGGYTGEFGNNGKVAMLHEKELVLNQNDTKNILDVVKVVRDYASMIRQAFGGGSAALVGNGSGDIQQTVQINADFSGVKSSNEIEKAFEGLANRAAQFAKRK